MFYQNARRRQAELRKKLKTIHQQINALPDGKLLCTRNGKNFKWYQSFGNKRVYIKKKDRPLAEQLAIKNYLSARQQEIEQELVALNFYIRHHKKSSKKSPSYYTSHPGFQPLLAPHFTPLKEELALWAFMPYDRNRRHPEHLNHRTVGGLHVRSKSESMIAYVLSSHHIPFRYECALTLGGITLYPDFTIRHPQTGEIFYWENFGLMDDANYCKNVINKFQLFFSNNIIPSIHLITTFETKDHPLTIEKIEAIVKEYFL